jgi:hypothetical protein
MFHDNLYDLRDKIIAIIEYVPVTDTFSTGDSKKF